MSSSQTMQTIIVYIIIGIAVLLTIAMLIYRFQKPQKCHKFEGCTHCPLAENCEKYPFATLNK